MPLLSKLLASVTALAALTLSAAAFARYKVTPLVSNQDGMARVIDPLLVTAWGLAYAPGDAYWTSDANSGWSTLYQANGTKESLDALIPTAEDGPGSPT